VAANEASLTRYLAELYTPRRELEADAKRIREAAVALAASGTPVRHLQSVFVPEEEICLHLFEAPDAGAVEQALREAGLEAERISVTLEPRLEDGSRPGT